MSYETHHESVPGGQLPGTRPTSNSDELPERKEKMLRAAVLKTPKGFTLIEVLSVVVIIGILAAVAIPSYMNYLADQRAKATEVAVTEVKSRLSLGYARYILENSGTEPSTIQDIVDLLGTDELPASSNGLVPNMGGFTVTMSGHGGDEATITVTKVKGVDVSMPADLDNTWTLP
jgi:prepilin-type N-terminal cleavage/methylation domain-containing protein